MFTVKTLYEQVNSVPVSVHGLLHVDSITFSGCKQSAECCLERSNGCIFDFVLSKPQRNRARMTGYFGTKELMMKTRLMVVETVS